MAVNNLNTPGVGIQPSLIDAKGDLLVGTADNVVNRLGVTGPTGSVLVTDAGETTGLKWVDPGTVGGLVHIKQQSTGGAVSSISVDDVFSDTYTHYKILMNLTGSTIMLVNLRLRVGGADNSSSNYSKEDLNASSTTVSAARDTAQTSWTRAGGNLSSSEKNISILEIAYPFQTAYTSALRFGSSGSGGNSITLNLESFGINVTTSYTGFTLLASTGTINGVIDVYGYKVG